MHRPGEQHVRFNSHITLDRDAEKLERDEGYTVPFRALRQSAVSKAFVLFKFGELSAVSMRSV
jgi:hypothetical protein